MGSRAHCAGTSAAPCRRREVRRHASHGRTAVLRVAHGFAPALERGVLPHAGAARQSGMRARGIFPAARRARSRACTPRSRYDPAEDVAAPYICEARGPRSRCCANRASTARPKWRPCSRRAGFDAYDVHMTDISRAAASRLRASRVGRLRRLLLRRRARSGRGLGEVDSVQCRCPRRVRAFFERAADLHAGRLQRLPDALGAEARSSRAPRLAALSCATAPSSTRRACRWCGCRDRARCCSPACRVGVADRGGARRGLREFAAGAGPAAAGRGVACSSSITATSRPSAIPSIRTDRRWGSPGYAAPTDASRR